MHCCIYRDMLSDQVLGRPLCWGIIYTGKHNISIYTGKQYFHSEKYQRPCFRASPQSPQTAHEGGESHTPFPNLSLRILKCPFRALSPCPIQILAGALLYFNGVNYITSNLGVTLKGKDLLPKGANSFLKSSLQSGGRWA